MVKVVKVNPYVLLNRFEGVDKFVVEPLTEEQLQDSEVLFEVMVTEEVLKLKNGDIVWIDGSGEVDLLFKQEEDKQRFLKFLERYMEVNRRASK